MINGAELDHHFFSNIRDVTLGLMLDGFQIFKAQRDGGATCWPLIALNFNLPHDSDNTYRTQLMNIQNAHSVGSQTQHEKDYGINRECILTELPSISISRSFPHNWMNLCIENHRKILISYWKGMYKGMDEG